MTSEEKKKAIDRMIEAIMEAPLEGWEETVNNDGLNSDYVVSVKGHRVEMNKRGSIEFLEVDGVLFLVEEYGVRLRKLRDAIRFELSHREAEKTESILKDF